MQARSGLRYQVTALAGFAALLSALSGCRHASSDGFFEASGTLASMPEEVADLGGRGIWIVHDGIYVGADKALPMRTPFEFRDGELGDLKIGDRIAFRFRPRTGRRGFPFSARDVHRLTGPPPTPRPTSDKKSEVPDWLCKMR